jgi:hypothetical protein
MKNVIILLFILTFSMCSKDDKPQISSGIFGKWIWTQSSGGIAGVIETPETSGNQVAIEFSTNTCKKYINGNLDIELTYKIETGNSIRKIEETDLIIFENGWKQSIELDGNKLILYDECFDCFQNEYIRE